MGGLAFVDSKAGTMVRGVGPLDLVVPLYYYRWKTARAFNCQAHTASYWPTVDSQFAETHGKLPTILGSEAPCGRKTPS